MSATTGKPPLNPRLALALRTASIGVARAGLVVWAVLGRRLRTPDAADALARPQRQSGASLDAEADALHAQLHRRARRQVAEIVAALGAPADDQDRRRLLEIEHELLRRPGWERESVRLILAGLATPEAARGLGEGPLAFLRESWPMLDCRFVGGGWCGAWRGASASPGSPRAGNWTPRGARRWRSRCCWSNAPNYPERRGFLLAVRGGRHYALPR
jgi:hypothetical protein